MNPPPLNYNLLTAPWIAVVDHDNHLKHVGIGEVLTNAHQYQALADHSPITMASTYRLLVAILQDIYQPDNSKALIHIWKSEEFDSEKITVFCERHWQRFLLFDAATPFYQTSDVPLKPEKEHKQKSAGYLFYEQPAGTAVAHYVHAYDKTHAYCPKCCAQGLVAIPAFASSGGAGIKPSINGVPPIYVLPSGANLFEALAGGLLTPKYQPQQASLEQTHAWWHRNSNIVNKQEVIEVVDYLQSLTFAARRVRLFPTYAKENCTRCGNVSDLLVRTMLYEMGESRPKDFLLWEDPFAAYRLPPKDKDGNASDKKPTPIRPVLGRDTWREYEALFLPKLSNGRFIPPNVLLQRNRLINYAEERDITLPAPLMGRISVQCVGLRTDMKAKIFEWQQTGFQLAPSVLNDVQRSDAIAKAIAFAASSAAVMSRVWQTHFDHSKSLKANMLAHYWREVGAQFHPWVAELSTNVDSAVLLEQWLTQTQKTTNRIFRDYAEMSGRNAVALRKQVEAEAHCQNALRKAREKLVPSKESTDAN